DVPIINLINSVGKIYNVKPEGKYIHINFWEIGIIKNDDFDFQKMKVIPDGFLHFPYFIEIEFLNNLKADDCVVEVNKILSFL
ncbi:MAG: hypothetical protein ACXVP4_09460, partial [Bacteroidia bacterium]